ncbi:MAG: DNA internalization-related competence protein ComEC/Rec2 [Armatimonadota bacterium]|nr:DNA internalization-related competence protein ComEC/Rec2 [Armatimonadota bacterium]
MRHLRVLPPIAWAAAAFAAGIAAAEAWQPGLLAALGTLAAGCGTWALCHLARRRGLTILGAVCAFAALGLAHAAVSVHRQPAWPHAVDGQAVIARGVISEPPEAAAGGWRGVARLRALAAFPDAGPVRRVRGQGPRARQPPGDHDVPMAPVDGWVRIAGRGPSPDFGVGADVVLRGRFRRGRPAGNPGERAERDALRRRGLDGVIHLQAADGVTVLRPGGWSVRGTVASIRRQVVDGVLRALPAPQNALFLSLLVGIDAHLPAEIYQQFARAGLVHLLVVSGAQVAIVAGACAWAARQARLPLTAAAVSSGLGVAAFAALVGWAPSVGRAVIMAAVGLGALLLGRQPDRAATLATAVLALLALDPAALSDIGFQLSFAATWGLLFLTPILQRGLAWLGPIPAGALGVTLGAQAAVAPLLAFHFQSVPVAGLAANLVILPLIAILVPTGFALMPLVILLPAVGTPLLGLLRPGLDAVLWLGTQFGSLSWATVPTPAVPASVAAFFFVLLGGAAAAGSGMWLTSRAQRISAAATALVACAMWLGSATQPPPALVVTALDVGQGDAILIRSPSGRAALVDGGGEIGAERAGWDVGRRRVVPALRRAGLQRVDVLLLSHPHEDHVGGLPAVVENFPVGLVLDPGVPHPSPSYARWLRLIEAARIPYRIARAGVLIDLGGGVRLAILYPPDPIPDLDGDPVHAGGVVARLTHRGAALLLTGDAEAATERFLVDRGAPLASQVLKVGHHGSRTSTTRAFLDRVRPQMAVISVGADNVFGHPHPATLQALSDAGVVVYRTDLDGAVTLTSNGAGWHAATARARTDAGIR